MESNTFIFNGRSDGIGNRIEQLIYLQEYCCKHNLQCIYVWNNSSFRNYSPLIFFDKIIFATKIKNPGRLQIKNKSIFLRTKDFIPTFNFRFNIEIKEPYDTIVHIRATDRIVPNGKHDFSNKVELDTIIRKTIDYINNSTNIQTYTIVSDDTSYKNYVKEKISKKYVNLCYDYNNIPLDWLDYYYLTKPTQSIIMSCKFSSFSITASILGNKPLLIFSQSLKSNLPRYKANFQIIG